MPEPEIKLLVALDSDVDDPSPVWTDLSSRVFYGQGGSPVTVDIGRQNEMAEIQPTNMAWALRNGDNAFTPRNPGSPHAGKWEQGRRCQIIETVGGEDFPLGTGFLEIPEMAVVDPLSAQPVTVTAVDRMGRLDSAPPFEGTLAEHVRTQGGPLAMHFPMSDSFPYMSSNTLATTQRLVRGFFDLPVPKDPEELVKAGGMQGPPGDDQSYALWEPAADADGDAFLGHVEMTSWIPAVPVAATDVVALSVWVRASAHELAPGAIQPDSTIVAVQGAASGLNLDFSLEIEDDRAAVRAYSFGSGGSTYVTGTRELERETWRLVTARVDFATGQYELWCGADMAVSGTKTNLPPAGTNLLFMSIGSLFHGAIGHIQVRVGPAASTMTRAMHIAQHVHGFQGLQRQTVAERLVTLAGYAGIPATELAIPSSASTPLQAAKLAGQSPAASFRAAAAAGQDTLITTGQGYITVVPRAQRYGQAVAMQIPFGWIGRGGLRYKPDRPVTDVTVTRTGGGTVRRSDPVRARRYGVTGQQYQLDTAIDEDPSNLASWALAAFGQMRTRCPSIRINMLRTGITVAERKQMLRLKVGDLIELTGLPAGSPDDVPWLIIQGIKHTIGPGRRRTIEFNTSPLLGPTPGVPPPCPVVGDLVSASAVIAY